MAVDPINGPDAFPETPEGQGLSSPAVQSEMVRAIQDGRLETLVSALSEADPSLPDQSARDMVSRARSALDAIESGIGRISEEIHLRLSELGVEILETEPKLPAVGSQFQRLTITVPARHAAPALRAAADVGYLPARLMSAGALRALVAFDTGIKLMRRDRVGTRLTLKWRGSGPRARVPRLATPRLADLLFVALPAALWPLYCFVKPARLVYERAAGRSVLDTRDSYLAGINLGTPDDLIGPLLESAGLSANDTFLDIGCGDGRVVIEAARRFGCRAIGVERNLALARLAQRDVAESGLDDKVRIVEGDATGHLVSEASLVFMFLPPVVLDSLLPRALEALAPDARLLVHEQLPLPEGFDPDTSVPVFGSESLTVAHLWNPASATGMVPSAANPTDGEASR